MASYREMVPEDCRACRIHEATHVTLAFRAAPHPYCWVRLTDRGVVARAVAAFCSIHQAQHLHYIDDMRCASNREDSEVCEAYTTWIKHTAGSSESWMPCADQAWAKDVMRLFYGRDSKERIFCEDTDMSSYTLVCTRTGAVVDNNPCVALEWRPSGGNAGVSLMHDPTQDVGLVHGHSTDVLTFVEDCIPLDDAPVAARKQTKKDLLPPPASSSASSLLGFAKQKKTDRATSTCRKTLGEVEEDVICIVQGTLHCSVPGKIPAEVAVDAQIEFDVAHISFDRWRNFPWVPTHQIMARTIARTRTTANYSPAHDMRRHNYYRAIVIHVGVITAWALGKPGGLCAFHSTNPSDPVWHPNIATLRKITAGTLSLMGTTGLQTRVLEPEGEAVEGYDRGRQAFVLPADPVLISALRIYQEMQNSGAGGSVHSQHKKRGDSARVHYKRCDMSKQAKQARGWFGDRRARDSDEIGMRGLGIDLSYVADGTKMVEQSIEKVSKVALDGEGSQQRTAVRLLRGLMGIKLWHDSHQLQQQAKFTARNVAERDAVLRK